MKPYELHGKRYEPEYQIWASIVKRCYDKGSEQYHDYGGRGIVMCDEWRLYFDLFYYSLGPRPEGATIERRDVNGNYEPSNCYWESDRGVQSFNTRKRKDNTSGKAGVMWDTQRDKWQAFLYKDKKRIFLGRFDHLQEAIEARQVGELEHYGRLKNA